MRITSGDKVNEWASRDIAKIMNLLPFWGLRLENEKILPAHDHKTVSLYCSYEDVFEKVQHFLSHTGIRIKNTDKQAADFIIYLTDDHQFPITIQTGGLTYHLKPLTSTYQSTTQRYIHKNIWLPASRQPKTVHINTAYKSVCSEWMTYLIIQSLAADRLQPLHHIPLSQYQHMAAQILYGVNSAFAATQAAQPKEWPETPVQEGEAANESRRKEEAPNTNPRNEKESNKTHRSSGSLLGKKGNKTKNKGQFFKKNLLNPSNTEQPPSSMINPFDRKKTSNNNPFNPFKKRR